MDPMEVKILQFLDRNYERLKLEGGHALTEDVKQLAMLQVILYWRKLKVLADKISDAEVRIALPNQKTPKGRTFSIEGVVDIVREGDVNQMYDIKTHDHEYIAANKELYEEQLNVYAHVWQELRKNKLDLTAVISTTVPHALREAIRFKDEARIAKELEQWDPIIPITVHQDKVKETINLFGDVIDKIEDCVFPCPPIEDLKKKVKGNEIFATNVCRNCDGRFSCDVYREYAQGAGRGKGADFMKYFEPSLDADEQEDWLEANVQE